MGHRLFYVFFFRVQVKVCVPHVQTSVQTMSCSFWITVDISWVSLLLCYVCCAVAESLPRGIVGVSVVQSGYLSFCALCSSCLAVLFKWVCS